jgi:transposase
VKTNKNDYIDAEAIAEAVGRANMRFVPIKSDDQLDRYIKLGAAGKDQRKVVTAVARELLGFIWAIGTRAETVASQQVAA